MDSLGRNHASTSSTISSRNEKKIESLHKKLLYVTLAVDFLHPTVNNGTELDRFRAHSKIFFDSPASTSLKRADEILEELERRGTISVGNYIHLKEIVRFNRRLVEEVERVEIAIICNGGNVVRSVCDNGSDDVLALAIHLDETLNEISSDIKEKIQENNDAIARHTNGLIQRAQQEWKEFNNRWKLYNARQMETVKIIRTLHRGKGDAMGGVVLTCLEKGKELLFENNNDIYEFNEKWKEINERLVETSDVNVFLSKKGAEIDKVLDGCIIVFLKFPDKERLDKFWAQYQVQSLRTGLKEIVLKDENCPFDFLRVTVAGDNYRRHRRFYISNATEQTMPSSSASPRRSSRARNHPERYGASDPQASSSKGVVHIGCNDGKRKAEKVEDDKSHLLESFDVKKRKGEEAEGEKTVSFEKYQEEKEKVEIMGSKVKALSECLKTETKQVEKIQKEAEIYRTRFEAEKRMRQEAEQEHARIRSRRRKDCCVM